MAIAFPQVKDITDDLLICGFCHKHLSNPKLLPCQHSCCLECLKAKVSRQNATFACPTCEQSVSVSNGDVGTLPDDYLFAMLQENRQTTAHLEKKCGADDNDNEERGLKKMKISPAKAAVKDKLGPLQNRKENEERFLSLLNVTAQELADEKIWAENQIHDAATKLHGVVDKVKNERLLDIQNHYTATLARLEDSRTKTQLLMKQTEATKKFAEVFLKFGTEEEIENHADDVKSRAKACIENAENHTITTIHMNVEQKPYSETIVEDIVGKISSTEITTSGNGDVLAKDISGKVIYDVDTDLGGTIGGIAIGGRFRSEIFAVRGRKVGVFGNDGKHEKWIECEDLRAVKGVVAKYHEIYIADSFSSRRKVYVMDMDGKVDYDIFMSGRERKFGGIHIGLALDRDGNLFIASSATNTIYKHSCRDRTTTQFITESSQHQLKCPAHICVTDNREVIVSNRGSHTIQAYDMNPRLLWEYDGRIVDVDGSMALSYPEGVCCDGMGYVYVCCRGNRRIQVLRGGKFMFAFKMKDLSSPEEICSNWNRELIVTNGRNLMKIQVWK